MELNTDDNLPEFFKVYVSHHSSHKMLIPGEFVDYMEGKKSGQAQLAGPNGHTWRVELVEDGKDVYFSDGWQAFVEDNMIRDGDFLFFKFHRTLIFDVVIYDESMCEKGLRLMHVDKCNHLRRDGILETERVQNGVKPVKKRTRRPEADDSMFPSEDRTPIIVNPSFEKCFTISHKGLCSLMLPSSFVQEHSLSYNSNEKMVLQTGRNSSWEVTVINSYGAILLRKGISVFVRENNIRAGDVCKFELLDRLKMFVKVAHKQEGITQKNVNTMADCKRPSKKAFGVSQSKPSCGSAEDQKPVATSGDSFVNAVFISCMRKYNVDSTSLVHIPSWFVRENSLHYKEKEKMILRTTTDSAWPVNILNNKNQCTFSGGWAAFVRDNNIKEGDTCKFELVNRLEMKVDVQHSPKLE